MKIEEMDEKRLLSHMPEIAVDDDRDFDDEIAAVLQCIARLNGMNTSDPDTISDAITLLEQYADDLAYQKERA